MASPKSRGRHDDQQQRGDQRAQQHGDDADPSGSELDCGPENQETTHHHPEA
jgi:hypothetical protein